jgi:transcriptional regulator GlxA family with amidase domain
MLQTSLWQAHREAHRRNFRRRLSETAEQIDPDSRLKPPRYWLVHTLSHILIRQLAMTCGYSAASLSERLYAWPESEGRPAAAGLLICTTASDSDGSRIEL